MKPPSFDPQSIEDWGPQGPHEPEPPFSACLLYIVLVLIAIVCGGAGVVLMLRALGLIQ